MKSLYVASLAILMFVACTPTQKNQSMDTKNNTSENTLEGTYWVLTELNGQPVTSKDGEKPSYIYFNAEKKRVGVSGGCNVMGGGYELLPGNRIKFSQMMSTMMACPDMTTEEGLRKMTELVDNYAILDGNLSFAKARMAPAARFKAMPFPKGFSKD